MIAVVANIIAKQCAAEWGRKVGEKEEGGGGGGEDVAGKHGTCTPQRVVRHASLDSRNADN